MTESSLVEDPILKRCRASRVTNRIVIQQPEPIEQGPSGGGDTRQNTECNHILILMVRKVFSDLLGRGLPT